MNIRSALCLAACALGAGLAAAGSGRLHVPSPDWRDQVIYFVMTDRFADGDPRNNDLGAGEYDPARNSHYSGGDLRGLRQRLDYIRGLGATAVWLTPPVANQWLDPTAGYTGYHGYWAEHFKRVDRHLGTLGDYRALSRALHGRGMYLVQDIVLNHTGNFFDYRGGWDPSDPARFYAPNLASRPVSRPTQPPFDLNDPRRARDRRAGIYHWTPGVRDYNDPDQEARFQMSGLDDLATGNPVVRRALRDSYAHWIRAAGVDAFRVDTAFYVPPEDIDDFLHAKDGQAPGVLEAARRTGRKDFHVFGEGFGIDKPYDDTQARKIERWMTAPDGRPLMPGMLNFPLYGALGDVFARGRPTAELAHRIERTMTLHARPHLMPTFVDNHDVDRFLAGGSVPALRQALLAIFTLPGIPTLYYGTEQGFTEQRAAMFAGGHGSGGRDRFDTSAPLYRTIAALSALRRGDKVYTRGTPTVLARSAAAAGAVAWRMAAPGRAPAFVALNSADHPALLDKLPTGLPAGTGLRGRFGLDGTPADVTVGEGGLVTLALPARAGWVWQADGRGAAPAAAEPLTMDAAPERTAGDLVLRGTAPAGSAALRLVVDGDLAQAQTVQPDAQGRWQATVDTAHMVDAHVTHEAVLWDAETGAVSPTARFRVERAWQLLADVEDPAGDDAGPQGRYRYPTDASYAAQRTMDLRRVQVHGAGGALRLDLTMAGLSSSWNPPNGFDHLALTVYIELPGRGDGSTVMPLQNATLPQGMRWHRRLRVHGWSNALFTSEGAGAANEGTPAAAAAALSVDAAQGRISLTLPAAALGGASLAGARILVTTWDYDGGYRALAPQPQGHVIGGGDPATDARVMDESPVIVLPR
jgi:glycosidase